MRRNVVLTIGTFDLLHDGHRELFRESAKGGNILVVAVNRSEFVRRYKGRLPVEPMYLRMKAVRNEPEVTIAVVNFGDEDARIVIDCIQPDYLTIGDDWLDRLPDGKTSEERYFRQLGVTQEWMDQRNLWVKYIPRTTGISTTELRDSGAGSARASGT